MAAFGPELARSQTARQDHERNRNFADSLVASTKSLGRSAITDIYTAVRFRRDPESVPITRGIVGELNGAEKLLYYKLAIKDRVMGPEHLDHAFATYSETLDQIEAAEMKSEAVVLDTVE